MSNEKSECILIDVGSFTIKTYKYANRELVHLHNFSVNFKKDFSPESGISAENKHKLFDHINRVQKEHQDKKIKVFATAVFRKLSHQGRTEFKDEFYRATGLFFNVIEQDLENFYLERALVDKCNMNEPILLINIGGGSTELVVIKDKEPIEKANIDLGVGNINALFSGINNEFSTTSLANIVDYVKEQLPQLKNTFRYAIYSGGELTYMRLVDYPLLANTLFEDADHPHMILFDAFADKNTELFDNIKMSELESLMPENPTWMHGARGCSALAQAICEMYHVEFIVPSDADLIHGVVRQELKNVTISGSFRKHLQEILEVKRYLEANRIHIVSPRFEEPKNPGEEFVVFAGEEGMSPLELERYHLEAIQRSDALIVCNPKGYVGASAMIEIGYANALNKRIIFIEEPEEFMLNTLPAEIGLHLLD